MKLKSIILDNVKRERLNKHLAEIERGKKRTRVFCGVMLGIGLVALAFFPFVPVEGPVCKAPRAACMVPANVEQCPVCKQRAITSCTTFRCEKGHRFETEDVMISSEVKPAEFEKLHD